MTRHEAYIAKDWREHGLAHLIVARTRDDGSADYGVFLVDVWCLGVKAAFGEIDVYESAVRELVEERIPESLREPIHPTCAKKLIEGAIAYAEQLGFAPHRDFRKARRVLSSLDASLCPTEFAYGRDGRPVFVPAPDDSEERIARVLAILDARVGRGGYDYEPEDEDEDDILALREELMLWLAAEPEQVPQFYFLSGLLTALHLCPQVVPLSKVFDVLWPEGREWESEEELKGFSELLAEYWNYLADRVAAAARRPEVPAGTADTEHVIDVWQSDLPEEQAGEDYDPLQFMAAMIEWAQGFWRATEEWPDAWGDALTRADLADDWKLVQLWANYLNRESQALVDAAADEPVPRTLGRSVGALVRGLRPPGA